MCKTRLAPVRGAVPGAIAMVARYSTQSRSDGVGF